MEHVTATMVGTVFRICAEPGAAVEVDEPVVILESMKMELPIPAPRSGVVRELRVQLGDVVQEGDVIAILE